MQFDAALNLVFPVRWKDAERPDPQDASKTISSSEPLIYAYHTPISREVFDSSYRVIAATKAAIFGRGVSYAADAGPRIATLVMLDAAKADAEEWGTQDMGPALRAEIRRLTQVLVPGANGFDPLPIDLAVSRKMIDDDEMREAEAAIIFFTVSYAMASRARRQPTARASALVLGASITSLGLMEFAASLATSTPAETSTESVPASSVPS